MRSALVVLLSVATGCHTTGGKVFGTAGLASGAASVYLLASSETTIMDRHLVTHDDRQAAGAALMFTAAFAAAGWAISELMFGSPSVGGGGGWAPVYEPAPPPAAAPAPAPAAEPEPEPEPAPPPAAEPAPPLAAEPPPGSRPWSSCEITIGTGGAGRAAAGASMRRTAWTDCTAPTDSSAAGSTLRAMSGIAPAVPPSARST
ncbi:MAG TPA: hypothetical protein VGD37_26620 [Kofleriaceae bacterium]